MQPKLPWRVGLSKLEAGLRYVTDAEIILLTEVLDVPYTQLFPAADGLATAVQPFRVSGDA